MDSDEFRKAAQSAVDESKAKVLLCKAICSLFIVIDYYDNIHNRRVVSNVAPGYLRKLLPSGPPEEGERWAEIQKDIELKIMPGLTHWYI